MDDFQMSISGVTAMTKTYITEAFSSQCCHITVDDRKKNAATPSVAKVRGDCTKSSKGGASCNSLGGLPPSSTKMEGVKGSDHDYVFKTFNSSSLTLCSRFTPSTGSHFNKSWSGSGQVQRQGGDV